MLKVQFLKKHFNFLHQMATSYGAIAVNILIFAFLTPFMLKNLGKEQYGIWQLVSNISMYFSMGALGLGNAFYLELNLHKSDFAKTQKLINTVFFTFLFVGIFSLLFFGIIIYNFDTLFIVSADFLTKAKFTFLFSFLAFLVVFLFGFFDLILLLNHKITTRNIAEIVKICVNGLGSILLIATGFDIVSIAILYFICNASQIFYNFYISKKLQVFTLNFRYFDFNYLKTLYRSGIYFFIYTLSVLVIMNTDNILISHFMGAASVSLYAVIFRFVTISEKFIFVINTVKTPKVSAFIAQNNFSAVFDIYKKVWIVTFLTSTGVAIFLSLFGTKILEIWLGNRFEYDVILIYIFSVFIVFHSLSSVTAWFMGGLNIIKIQSIVSIIEIFANIFLSIFLYKDYGLRGIALGTLISHIVVSSWFPTWYLVKYLKNKIQT